MKVNLGERRNTCVKDNGTVRMQVVAQLYKLMERREVKKRVQAGWNGWRRMSVLSDLRQENSSYSEREGY